MSLQLLRVNLAVSLLALRKSLLGANTGLLTVQYYVWTDRYVHMKHMLVPCTCAVENRMYNALPSCCCQVCNNYACWPALEQPTHPCIATRNMHVCMTIDEPRRNRSP